MEQDTLCPSCNKRLEVEYAFYDKSKGVCPSCDAKLFVLYCYTHNGDGDEFDWHEIRLATDEEFESAIMELNDIKLLDDTI